jgi:aspartyl-tRNA synthetase
MNRWYSSHHPFTAPVAEDIPLLEDRPEGCAASITTSWSTASSSAVAPSGSTSRTSRRTIFEEILQIPPDETKLRFGYMLEAFRYGAPPHGGIALGFDRLCAMLCGTTSIRDVIAFPKTAKGTCLMTDSPSAVTPRQLRDLYLEVKTAKKE